MPDMDIPAQLRAWAKEIREQSSPRASSYPTGKEDADLLESAASEIERLRKQLAREGS
jgi:transposase-like protein